MELAKPFLAVGLSVIDGEDGVVVLAHSQSK
jgi:hypothetical protein